MYALVLLGLVAALLLGMVLPRHARRPEGERVESVVVGLLPPAVSSVEQPVEESDKQSVASSAVAEPSPISVPDSCDRWLRNSLVVLDGTNVCYWNRPRMSLAPLLSICRDLRRRGVAYTVYFDASTRFRLRRDADSGEAELYGLLLQECSDRFHEVPAGRTADEAVLKRVEEEIRAARACLYVTQDLYRDHVARYSVASDETRRLMGHVTLKGISFPRIGWHVPFQNAA